MLKIESWVIDIVLIIYLLKHNYNVWFENEESTDTTSRKSDKDESVYLSEMPSLEDDEEVKEVKKVNIFNFKQIID